MGQFSMKEAMEDMEHNRKRAEEYPEKQKEFLDEYMYSDPNNFEEMKELYAYYGYRYSLSLWAYQQGIYNEASKVTEERLKND